MRLFTLVVLCLVVACTADRSGLSRGDASVPLDVVVLQDRSVDSPIDILEDLPIDLSKDTELCIPSCSGNLLVVCNGNAPMRRDCPTGCDPAALTCNPMPTLVPANVPTVSFLPSSSDVTTVSGGATWNTDNCNQLPGGIEQGAFCVVRAVSFVVEDELRVIGSRPLIVLAHRISISGIIKANGTATEPGAGGFWGAPTQNPKGIGDFAGGRGAEGSFPNVYSDGGGGGGGHCSAGAPGGKGGANNEAGGIGGPRHGELVRFDNGNLVGGSGGGSSAPAEANNEGTGGHGGGAIQLSSLNDISISGRIDVSGGGGKGGNFAQPNRPLISDVGAGGGGGAGGTVLLEALGRVDVTGAINAAGGGGGGGAACISYCAGVSSAGRPGANGDMNGTAGPAGDPCPSSNGCTLGNFRGNFGASGGEGATENRTAKAGDPSSQNAGNGGGGGGGVGCVVAPQTLGGQITAIQRTRMPIRQ